MSSSANKPRRKSLPRQVKKPPIQRPIPVKKTHPAYEELFNSYARFLVDETPYNERWLKGSLGSNPGLFDKEENWKYCLKVCKMPASLVEVPVKHRELIMCEHFKTFKDLTVRNYLFLLFFFFDFLF